MLLEPKKTKHKKWQKGKSRSRTVETRGTTVEFGKWGLQSLGSAYVTSRQIESARKSISHHTKRGGKLWIRIFPYKPITKRPPEKTMGGGKGPVDHYVFPVNPGRILFELDGVEEKIAVKALNVAGNKFPVKTRILTRD